VRRKGVWKEKSGRRTNEDKTEISDGKRRGKRFRSREMDQNLQWSAPRRGTVWEQPGGLDNRGKKVDGSQLNAFINTGNQGKTFKKVFGKLTKEAQ